MSNLDISQSTLKNYFANCRITERAFMVVEGKDDISFYDKIAREAKKNVKIKAIENVLDYNEGCDNVISMTRDMQPIFEADATNLKYFLGVIDADVRKYRDEAVDLLGLLILKYYSYETHYVLPSVAANYVYDFTGINNDLLTTKLENFLFKDFKKEALEKFYYPSLEALKNSINGDYTGLIGYSKIPLSNPEKLVNSDFILLNEQFLSALNEKKTALNEFSELHGIEYSYDHLKSMVKGKWLLDFFIRFLLNKIPSLPKACIEKDIETCQYCEEEKDDKCLYKPNLTITIKNCKGTLFNYLDPVETKYIIERFKSLN
jgi:hypothetical protein